MHEKRYDCTWYNLWGQVIIVSNDVANHYSSLVTIVPVTSKVLRKHYPHEVEIQNGTAKVSQLRSVDKSRLQNKIKKLSPGLIEKIDFALKLHLDL